MQRHDLTVEEWREYQYGNRVHRISRPQALYARSGGSTHRVVDADGIVHCVPAPGAYGCLLTWKPVDSSNPVAF